MPNFCGDIGNFPVVSKIKLPKTHHYRSQDERLLNRSDLRCLVIWKEQCIEQSAVVTDIINLIGHRLLPVLVREAKGTAAKPSYWNTALGWARHWPSVLALIGPL